MECVYIFGTNNIKTTFGCENTQERNDNNYKYIEFQNIISEKETNKINVTISKRQNKQNRETQNGETQDKIDHILATSVLKPKHQKNVWKLFNITSEMQSRIWIYVNMVVTNYFKKA